MKARGFLIAAFWLLTLGGFAIAQDDAQAIRDVSMQWQELYNQGDLQGVANLYTEDAWWANFDGSVHEGRDAILQCLQNPDPIATDQTQIEVTPDEVTVTGDTGYSRGMYVLSGLDGSPIAQGHWLVVAERVDGQWLVSQHISNAMMPSPEQEQGNAHRSPDEDSGGTHAERAP